MNHRLFAALLELQTIMPRSDPKVGAPPLLAVAFEAGGRLYTADAAYATASGSQGGAVVNFVKESLRWLLVDPLGLTVVVLGCLAWIIFHVAYHPKRGLGTSRSLRAGDLRRLADEASRLRLQYNYLIGCTGFSGEPLLSNPVNDLYLPATDSTDFSTIKQLQLFQFRASLKQHISAIEEMWAGFGRPAKWIYGPMPVFKSGSGIDW